MLRWWRSHRRDDGGKAASAETSAPSNEPTVVLPDPEEAERALAQAKEGARRTEALGTEVREWLAFLRAAREENNFAEGIVEMIREGK